MCLIAFAIEARPGLPLLLASNRDEFFERPTAALHRWSLEGGVEVLAGRDLRDGGTWLGVSSTGRVAMLTNVRGLDAVSGVRSRGELATRWLQAAFDAAAMAREIDPKAYAGFNLVVGDLHRSQWAWLSNCDPARPHAGPQSVLAQQTLAPGIYGLSNASLDTPWPKTLRLKAAMQTALQMKAVAGHGEDAEPPRHTLITALADATPAPPDRLPATGIAPAHERALSAAFVHLPEAGYGTRSSLVLQVQGTMARSVQAWEWTHTPQPTASQHGWNSQQLAHHSLSL
jgi:uncharacterized protein with NRDE domain